MKFGRYLQENATPEWKKAYIDYRGAKKAIKRISACRANRPVVEDTNDLSSEDDDNGPSAKPRRNSSAGSSALARIITGGQGSAPKPSSPSTPNTSRSQRTPRSAPISPLSPHPGSQASRSNFPRSPGGTTRPSPGYGATGTSPPLEESQFPPPLDLGEPTIPTSPDLRSGQASSSSSTLLDPRDINRERLKGRVDSARSSGFSPNVTSIPEGSAPEVQESRSSEGDQPTSPDTPTTPTTPLTHEGRRIGHGVKGSPGKLSFKTHKSHASVGVSPGSVADAPSGLRSLRSMRLPSPQIQPRQPQTVEELYETLNSEEQGFFDLLDKELDRVDNFYIDRERDATRRYSELKDQLNALAEHRRIFHEQFPGGQHEWETKVELYSKTARVPILGKAVKQLHSRVPFHNHTDDENQTANDTRGRSAAPTPTPSNRSAAQTLQVPPSSSSAYSTAVSSADGSAGGGSQNGSDEGGNSGDNVMSNGSTTRESRVLPGKPKQFDPERYQRYKKELRAAVLEYYRELELIKNFRITNLTGFRKALKKFEKVTGIPCLEMYTDERINSRSFSRAEPIDQLIKQTEELFTEHFEHGDVKKARQRLRNIDSGSTHYQTIFRSGTYLGLGLPAAVMAIVQSFQPSVREQLPQWNALLQVYGALYLPVLFGIMFELNLDAWVEARINYEFVMELQRPVLDYRSYLEIPAFLFLTLSYCFFFSFYFINLSTVAPTTWPLAWLVFAVAFFLNPLPIFRRRSRYWVLRVLFRVLTPGISRVEFIAFFMADELNSLTYSIQNFMFMGCCFSKHWPANVNALCPLGSTWPYALLACVAPGSRLIQCLKRYVDSRLYIHLINAGKYGMTILTAWMYFLWRARGSKQDHYTFALWVLFASFNSIYTCSWDFVVDWSLFRPGYKGLRPDRAYGSAWYYYTAIVTNAFLRAIWIWYIPEMGRLNKMRGWLFALLEMLRRWQWNFFRLETEHLGNADVYRATRDVPLPYRQDDRDRDEIDENGESIQHSRGLFEEIAHRFRLKVLGDSATGRMPGSLNVGAMGHAPQREYEAPRRHSTPPPSPSPV